MSLKEAIKLNEASRKGIGRPEGDCQIIAMVAVAPSEFEFGEEVLQMYAEGVTHIKNGDRNGLAKPKNLVESFLSPVLLGTKVLREDTADKYPTDDRIITPIHLKDYKRLKPLGILADRAPTTVHLADVEQWRHGHSVGVLGTVGRQRQIAEEIGFNLSGVDDDEVLFYSHGEEEGLLFTLSPETTGDQAHRVLSEIFFPKVSPQDFFSYTASLLRKRR